MTRRARRIATLVLLLLWPLLLAQAPSPAKDVDAGTIAAAMVDLVFGANPAAGIPDRAAPARWHGPMRVFVAGGEAERRSVAAALDAIAREAGIETEIVASGQPTLFVASVPTPGAAFRGPLRPLLDLALAGDDAAIAAFTVSVIDVQRCWILPVWKDASHAAIRAAIVGSDAAQGAPDADRCIARELAAAAGLLGPEVALPRSVFDRRHEATRYSHSDRRMLRALYDPALPSDLTRENASAAFEAALRHPARR